MKEQLNQLHHDLEALHHVEHHAALGAEEAVRVLEGATQHYAKLRHQVELLHADVDHVSNGEGQAAFSEDELALVERVQEHLSTALQRLKDLAAEERIGVIFRQDEAGLPAAQALYHEMATCYESLETLRWLMEEANVDAEPKGQPELMGTREDVERFFANL